MLKLIFPLDNSIATHDMCNVLDILMIHSSSASKKVPSKYLKANVTKHFTSFEKMIDLFIPAKNPQRLYNPFIPNPLLNPSVLLDYNARHVYRGVYIRSNGSFMSKIKTHNGYKKLGICIRAEDAHISSNTL